MNATVTESKFNALKSKLRELFELDKSDLDFGIYRIIAAKNKEVTEFLDRQLKDVVRATLAAHGVDATDRVQAELDKTIASLQAAEVPEEQIESNKKVTDLRSKLAASGSAAAADLEADIYNHLLAFFGRYYDEGDFISQRRYKGDTYAIPYSGEEVTLYWANKDQYYIKSGEWHKDYRFKAGTDGKSVRFKLVEATQEVGNNKEADDAKRRYILAINNPVDDVDGTLTLRFEFRVPTQADIVRVTGGCVAMFGGDFAKPSNPKKGDEREQFCADAEARVIAAMPEAWKSLIAVPGSAGTADKPSRTLLGKHLDRFSARNTFDYFIHKDLGGFMRRELDFYLKNEVVRLDDLESLPPDHLQRVQGKVKAIRVVASRLITFLAALEDFQKKMWLKKKFVLNTNWLVTVDRIPPSLLDTVAHNTGQWTEWERLGFKPGPSQIHSTAEWGTRDYLNTSAGRGLVVDTAFYDDAFRCDLLSSESVLASHGSVSESTVGVLINSDNFQALNFLHASYRERIKCAYVDPPYNTNATQIIYKNGYLHSSWCSLIYDRMLACRPLLDGSGVHQIAIDDMEFHRLEALVHAVFGREQHLANIAIMHNPKGRDQGHVAAAHEYTIMSSKCIDTAETFRLPLDSAALAAKYAKGDGRDKYRELPLRRSGSGASRQDRPKMYFPFIYDPSTSALSVVPEAEYSRIFADGNFDDTFVDALRLNYESQGKIFILPIREDGSKGRWRWGYASSKDGCDSGVLRARLSGQPTVYQRDDAESTALPKSLWFGERYDASTKGTNLLKEVVGPNPFDYPKSLFAVLDFVRIGTDGDCYVLDYFAGSGTTGHAVIALNRESPSGSGDRKFLLVEMGAHFDSVLKPRISKVIYSPDWRGGIAQTHGQGVSSLVKYFGLESYEDALNNLPRPSGFLLGDRSSVEADELIAYSLDLECGPHLLNIEAFRNPWCYAIDAQLAGDAELKRHRVDLVETFNYLIGLIVTSYGPLERYSAEFERATHADGLGRLRLAGRLRRDAGGPFIFQRVEGVLNDGNSTRVLVVWRKLTDDPEKDAAVLDAWMMRHRESTRERTEHRDYHIIYINGPVTLPQPTAEIRTVYPIEETFKIKMFEDTDSASPMGGAHG
jgi:adenine-specific DNA-methyltransferase